MVLDPESLAGLHGWLPLPRHSLLDRLPASAIHGLIGRVRASQGGGEGIKRQRGKTELNWCSRAMHVCMSILFFYIYFLHSYGRDKKPTFASCTG